MPDRFVRLDPDGAWTLGNDAFALSIRHEPQQVPIVEALHFTARPDLNWAVPTHRPVPMVVAGGVRYALAEGNARLLDMTSDPQFADLRLRYALENGLEVTQHLQPSPDKAVWRSWVTLHNPTPSPIAGITRFDAANWGFSAGSRQPQCGYVLGWLEGPRARRARVTTRSVHVLRLDPQVPVRKRARDPACRRAGGWHAPVYRLVPGAALTRLPLRSGKRSTYETIPG